MARQVARQLCCSGGSIAGSTEPGSSEMAAKLTAGTQADSESRLIDHLE